TGRFAVVLLRFHLMASFGCLAVFWMTGDRLLTMCGAVKMASPGHRRHPRLNGRFVLLTKLKYWMVRCGWLEVRPIIGIVNTVMSGLAQTASPGHRKISAPPGRLAVVTLPSCTT